MINKKRFRCPVRLWWQPRAVAVRRGYEAQHSGLPTNATCIESQGDTMQPAKSCSDRHVCLEHLFLYLVGIRLTI